MREDTAIPPNSNASLRASKALRGLEWIPKGLRENATLTLLLYVMSHTALRPEALAMASHFLCVPLTYSNPLLAGAISLQAAASAAPPDLCPSSRTSTLLTKAEQHRTKAPRLLWRCLYDIYPFLHRPSPSREGAGEGGGLSTSLFCLVIFLHIL